MQKQLTKKIGNKLLVVTIKISDDCNNGFERICIEGSLYQGRRNSEPRVEFDGSGKGWYYDTNSGNDMIIEHFPQLAPIVAVDTCDMFGLKSYPLGNLQHFCQTSKEYAKKQYRLTEDEVKIFGDLNYTALAKRVKKLIDTRYKEEMSLAIKVLEELTEKTFTRKEFVSHELYNEIEYYILSKKPVRERGWNLINGKLPKEYQINLDL